MDIGAGGGEGVRLMGPVGSQGRKKGVGVVPSSRSSCRFSMLDADRSSEPELRSPGTLPKPQKQPSEFRDPKESTNQTKAYQKLKRKETTNSDDEQRNPSPRRRRVITLIAKQSYDRTHSTLCCNRGV